MPSQSTFFDHHKQTVTEAISLTCESMNAYGALYDHWAIAFSGGKDSTCVATLIPQLILTGKIPRPKSLTVLYADTRMELPPLQISAMGVMERLREMGIECRVVYPRMEDRFMVYMLGRGVPPPSNTFRWCTVQIKIDPMIQALKAVREEAGRKILMLTGVRIGESAVRDAKITVSCGKNGAECGQGWLQVETPEAVADTLAPILHWRVCRVWQWLRYYAPDAGFPTEHVADAYGGDEAEEVNCRTGCVGCNLASKDTALIKTLENKQWEYLRPLMKLRPLYAELKKPWNRLRKATRETRKDGTIVSNPNRMGPLTFEARRYALDQVAAIQSEISSAAVSIGRPKLSLIDHEEREVILGMIDAGVWPNGWSGHEPRADEEYTELLKDGSEQLHIDMDVERTAGRPEQIAV